MKSKNNSLNIIVLGFIIRRPLGGQIWHYLQYILGLKQLGHNVYYLEDSGDHPDYFDSNNNYLSTDYSFGIDYIKDIFQRFNIDDKWALFDSNTDKWIGPVSNKISKIISECDLLLNISGLNPIRDWFLEIPVRALIDTDPVFTQIRHLTRPWQPKNWSFAHNWQEATKHNVFFTFGENIPNKQLDIPDDNLPWKNTRQPVVLDLWDYKSENQNGKFTTVMNLNTYGSEYYKNLFYGNKNDTFKEFLTLPKLTNSNLEICINLSHASRISLQNNGWTLIDPAKLNNDPYYYKTYIQESKSEFSIAKHGYVVSKCGWFSERSANYLASGKPVLIQETGFSEWMETGIGVIPFNNMDEALSGIEDVLSNYDKHRKYARSIAQEYFDSRTILTNLVEHSMNQNNEHNHDFGNFDPISEFKSCINDNIHIQDKFIFVDGYALGDDFLKPRMAIPFAEKNGEFGGFPKDDAHAISELERLKNLDSKYFVVSCFTSGFFNHYKIFYSYLIDNYKLIVDNKYLKIFRLNN